MLVVHLCNRVQIFRLRRQILAVTRRRRQQYRLLGGCREAQAITRGTGTAAQVPHGSSQSLLGPSRWQGQSYWQGPRRIKGPRQWRGPSQYQRVPSRSPEPSHNQTRVKRFRKILENLKLTTPTRLGMMSSILIYPAVHPWLTGSREDWPNSKYFLHADERKM